MKDRARFLAAGLVLVCGAVTASPARSYDVEADTAANSIYILLRNLHPTAVFSSISLNSEIPGFVTQATASIVPPSVAASGSELAAVSFDVPASAPLGAAGELAVRVSGTASGKPVHVTLPIPLTVVATAPPAQGLVGEGVPVPDVGGVDTDGDGVSDLLEVAFGSDPSDPASVPGATLVVPFLQGFGVVALGLLLLFGGAWRITATRSAGRFRP